MSASVRAAGLPSVGSVAPDFTLRSTAELDVALSSFHGRKHVLLAFFPLAFTSTCTTEMQEFTGDILKFEGRETVVLPISVDSTATLKEFKSKWKMPFDLLSDFKRTVSRRYGVLNDEKFYSNRAYILIDKQGIVRWTWQERNNSDRRDNAELLEVLARLP
ncbi:MAG TPA: redoxin domain-containing protein [Gemmatimonadales bacterium]